MEIVYKNPADLIEAEYNPRKISDEDFAQLKKSLSNFDCVEPIVINSHEGRENIIVGGHQRLKAMKALKFKDVPCVEVDLPIEQEKQLNIRLNKNSGEWDFIKLGTEFDLNDLTDWGFLDSELEGDYSEIDIESVEEFSEKVSFNIKCRNIEELNIIQEKLSVSGTSISFEKFLECIC